MIASDEMKLEKLTKLVENFIIENYQSLLQNDSVGILQIVHYHQTLNSIQNFCLETICSDPKILLNSDQFNGLPATLLEVILKRDDLDLDEIEIWENLIKWGLSQNHQLNQDVSKWNQQDFQTFQNILYNLILLSSRLNLTNRYCLMI